MSNARVLARGTGRGRKGRRVQYRVGPLDAADLSARVGADLSTADKVSKALKSHCHGPSSPVTTARGPVLAGCPRPPIFGVRPRCRALRADARHRPGRQPVPAPTAARDRASQPLRGPPLRSGPSDDRRDPTPTGSLTGPTARMTQRGYAAPSAASTNSRRAGGTGWHNGHRRSRSSRWCLAQYASGFGGTIISSVS